jgi:hypothetical protein
MGLLKADAGQNEIYQEPAERAEKHGVLNRKIPDRKIMGEQDSSRRLLQW